VTSVSSEAVKNPFGFFMLLALSIWIAYSVVRALVTAEIHSRGMYTFRRDESPVTYWLVFGAHLAIIAGFVYALATFV